MGDSVVVVGAGSCRAIPVYQYLKSINQIDKINKKFGVCSLILPRRPRPDLWQIWPGWSSKTAGVAGLRW